MNCDFDIGLVCQTLPMIGKSFRKLKLQLDLSYETSIDNLYIRDFFKASTIHGEQLREQPARKPVKLCFSRNAPTLFEHWTQGNVRVAEWRKTCNISFFSAD